MKRRAQRPVDEQRVCLTRSQRAHVGYYHDFLLSLLFSTLWDDVQHATCAHEVDGNFLRSGISTYQRSCKINFFTITHCSAHASIRLSALSLQGTSDLVCDRRHGLAEESKYDTENVIGIEENQGVVIRLAPCHKLVNTAGIYTTPHL